MESIAEKIAQLNTYKNKAFYMNGDKAYRYLFKEVGLRNKTEIIITLHMHNGNGVDMGSNLFANEKEFTEDFLPFPWKPE